MEYPLLYCQSKFAWYVPSLTGPPVGVGGLARNLLRTALSRERCSVPHCKHRYRWTSRRRSADPRLSHPHFRPSRWPRHCPARHRFLLPLRWHLPLLRFRRQQSLRWDSFRGAPPQAPIHTTKRLGTTAPRISFRLGIEADRLMTPLSRCQSGFWLRFVRQAASGDTRRSPLQSDAKISTCRGIGHEVRDRELRGPADAHRGGLGAASETEPSF